MESAESAYFSDLRVLDCGILSESCAVDGSGNRFPKVDLASRIASRVVQQGLHVATVNICQRLLESWIHRNRFASNMFELFPSRTRSFGGIQLDVAKAVQDAAKVQT